MNNLIKFSFKVKENRCYNPETKNYCQFVRNVRYGTIMCSLFEEDMKLSDDTGVPLRLIKCKLKFSEEVEDV